MRDIRIRKTAAELRVVPKRRRRVPRRKGLSVIHGPQALTLLIGVR